MDQVKTQFIVPIIFAIVLFLFPESEEYFRKRHQDKVWKVWLFKLIVYINNVYFNFSVHLNREHFIREVHWHQSMSNSFQRLAMKKLKTESSKKSMTKTIPIPN